MTIRSKAIGRLISPMTLNLILIATAVLSVGACRKKEAPPPDAAKDKAAAEVAAKEKEALDSAVDAYIYAYLLVTMEYTRRTLTNTAAPEGRRRRWASLCG